MKLTIFARIVIATTLPILLIFVITFATINRIIYSNGVQYAKEQAVQYSESFSRQVEEKVQLLGGMLQYAAKQLGSTDLPSFGGVWTVDNVLRNLLASTDEVYCGWIVLERGVLGDDRYYNTFLRKDGAVVPTDCLSDELLDDPEQSPWYNIALSTGEFYFNMLEEFDYGTADGFVPTGTLAQPIMRYGQVIGCIGFDIRYENIFQFIDQMQEDNQRIALLLSQEGKTVYSPGNIFDDFSVEEWEFECYSGGAEAIRRETMLLEDRKSPLFGEHSLIYLDPIRVGDKPTLFLYVDMPTRYLYLDAVSAANRVVLIGLAGFCLLFFSIASVTHSIVAPIRRLTETARHIADGNRDADLAGIRFANDPGDEISMLEKTLAGMIDQIKRNHELELHNKEAELEKEKVISASHARTRLFANVSHEIRTPMNAILGVSQILLADKSLTEAQRRYIHDIKVSSCALVEIINDVLDFAKMESGEMTLSPVHYRLSAMLDGVCAMTQLLACQKGITFQYRQKGDLPSVLYGDELRLQQVLVNILGNAVKFTNSGTVTLTVVRNGNSLIFLVADTGIGIRQEHIPYLFEPFKQVDELQNRNVQGTGLGLAICQNLMEQMGGTIEATSTYGKGSVFTVQIPFVEGDEAGLGRVSAQCDIYYSEEPKILVVDDNAINLNVANGLLHTLFGIHSDIAGSGPEAIKKVTERRYDIIFMDHMMPEMDGIEATKRIRQLKHGKHAVIIALTANAVSGAREMLLEAGMDGFLAKPIQKEALADALNRWIPTDKRIRGEELEERSVKNGTPNLPMSLWAAEKIAGLDVKKGLEMMGGQQEAYEQSLRLLTVVLPGFYTLAEDLLQSENISELTVHVHGIRGSLASLGATELSQLAFELEEAGNRRDLQALRQGIPGLLRQLRRLEEKLREAFPENADQTAKPSGDSNRLEPAALRLADALVQHDYDAIHLALSEMRSYRYNAEIESFLDKLSGHVEMFCYEEALSMLKNGLAISL